MKKIAALIILVLFLSSMEGYYLVYLGVSYRNSLDFSKKQENKQAHPAAILELKVVVNLPYQAAKAAYFPLEGNHSLSREGYRATSYRYSGDTLCIRYSRDERQHQLFSRLTEVIRFFTGYSSSNDPGHKIQVKSTRDFLSQPRCIKDLDPVNGRLSLMSLFESNQLHLYPHAVITPPPKPSPC